MAKIIPFLLAFHWATAEVPVVSADPTDSESGSCPVQHEEEGESFLQVERLDVSISHHQKTAEREKAMTKLLGESGACDHLMQDFPKDYHFCIDVMTQLTPLMSLPPELQTVPWPYSNPLKDLEQQKGPWPDSASSEFNGDPSPQAPSRLVNFYAKNDTDASTGYFTKSPLIGSVPGLKAKDGSDVPLPHSIQDAEGIGIVGTANLEEVQKHVPRPWVPVKTKDGKATWSTWKDIERVNYLTKSGETDAQGNPCQRQWIVFYVKHEDDKRVSDVVEDPMQLLLGQFAGEHLYYLYNYKMFTSCETMVKVDNKVYNWDSHLAEHDYQRDTDGNLRWKVKKGGKTIMDMSVTMPYGVPFLLINQAPKLLKYGTNAPDPTALRKFLTKTDYPIHWVTKPFSDRPDYTQVIYSPFSMRDTPAYPSADPHKQWDGTVEDTDAGPQISTFASESWMPKDGPFGVNSPLPEEDFVTWTDPELYKLEMKLDSDFTLAFYTYHFRMQWENPWTFVKIRN